MNVRYIPSGDSAFILRFGTLMSEEINQQIRALTILLNENKPQGVIEFVPSYTDLLVTYDPLVLSYTELLKYLKKAVSELEDVDLPKVRIIEIPVCYGDEFGEDMEAVKKETALSLEKIVEYHSAPKYLVYMLGFTPGFCYLGGMDHKIATPRKEVPSQLIKAGSVGIAANQTGIYPIDSPGGWQIIGRTPLKIFDPEAEDQFLISAGDYIKFKPIDKSEYERILKSQDHG